MTITISKVGKVSSSTRGPWNGQLVEIQADGLHCNMNGFGIWVPQPRTPLMAWECLIYS